MSASNTDKGQGTSADVPPQGVDHLVPLVTLKKNWAKGERQTFLTSHLDTYKDACLVSRASAAQALDKIINAYFVKFHWSLAHTSLPGVLPLVRFDADGFEILSAEEAIHKGQVIAAMKKSAKKDDPIAILLHRLLGDPSPPKRHAGWEAWGKDNFQSLKADFDAEFEATNGLEKNRVKECNKFKRQEFAKLSEDEKEKWSEVVRLEWEEAKRLIKDRELTPRLLEPADAQKVLDSLPSVLGPLIEGVGEAIGMHVTVLIGGPEPKKQGQLNTISMHYGVDKQAVPKVWGQADKAGFKLVTNAFTAFLETCYSTEEQRARTLAKDSHQDDLLHPTNAPSDPSQAPSTSAKLPSASKASDSELSAHVGGKRKRNVKGKDGKKSKKQKKQEKKRAFVVSDDDDEDEEESDKEKAGDDDDNSGNGEELPRRHSNRLKGFNTGMITPSEEPSTLTDTSTVAAPAGCPLVRSAQLDQSVPRLFLAPPPTPSSSPTRTPLTHGPAPPSQPSQSTTPLPVPRLLPQPSPQPSPPLVMPQPPPKPPLPLDSSWPAWFQRAYTDLSLAYLSAELTSAIRIYVDFEKKAGFVVGSPNAGFKVDNRPPEVAFWVGRGRKSAPLVKDLPSFEA
ncbi:hypothetical protein K443DRAFT_14946, partial [Laccaria amethystina LaAM-08-1]